MILVNENSKLIVQGLTGKTGRFHAEISQQYGTKIVAGVTPGRGGEEVLGVPIFDTVAEAREQTGGNVSVVFVPPPAAADAITEAAAAGVELVVTITEGIPPADMVKTKQAIKALGNNTRLVGPNCPGVISPAAKVRVGILPPAIFQPGNVGVISRSGTLTYETVAQLAANGYYPSTCLGIGGDPVVGMGFIDVLEEFENDPETKGVVLIGEIGGDAEQRAAYYFRDHMTKPLVAYVTGVNAPPGKRMGHAGAIVAGKGGSAKEKIATFNECGVPTALSPTTIGEVAAKTFEGKF